MRNAILTPITILLAFAPAVSSSGYSSRSPAVNARIIASHENSLVYAYESTFKTQTYGPKVKAVVRFGITAPGDVEAVEILALEGFETTMPGPALAEMFTDKVKEAVYSWKFPPVMHGITTVETPYAFVPDDKELPKVKEELTSNGRKFDFDSVKCERTEEGIYRYDERVIKCRREQAVYVEIPRFIPDAGIFEEAAKKEVEKTAREFLKDVGTYFDERRKPAAANLVKKLAARERELAEVEANLTEEESRLAVADLGLSDKYDWDVKRPNAKKLAKLPEKRGRLSTEIEQLKSEISTAEETRSRSLAGERTELMARGEELLSTKPREDSNPWLVFALAELYLDSGEAVKAAPLFERVIEKGNRTAVPEALYGLAQAYADGGDVEKASQNFLSLATEYPDSAYQGESCFRLGKYFTSQREPKKAEEYYLLAAEIDDEHRDAALYRAAWGYYECSGPLGTAYYDRAVPAFRRFLDAADESSPYWKHAVEMAGLCLAEWEPGTAERPAPLGALNRYDDVFGGTRESAYAADVLRALGDAYLYRMDKLPEAATTYEYLLEKYPSYGDAAGVIQSIVESDLRREAYDDAHAARVHLVDEYGPASSWYRAQDEPARCRALLSWEDALYEVGVYYNMQAERKSRTKPEEAQGLYESTITRYNQYLASFPTNEKAYHINFYLAEVYFALEDNETAAQQYIKTATHYTDRERYKIDKWDEKFTQEHSFYKAILSYEELYEEKAGFSAGSAGFYAGKLITSCEEFLDRYPESSETPEILKLMAETYAREGDSEKAGLIYTRIEEGYLEPVNERFDNEKILEQLRSQGASQ